MRDRVTLRGRSEEMRHALTVLRATTRYRTGATIVVSGPPGIGKTTLMREIAGQARILGAQIITGTCHRVDALRAGAALVSALRSGPSPLVDAARYEAMMRACNDPLRLAEEVATALEDAAAVRAVMLIIDDAQWADATTLFVLRRVRTLTAGLPIVLAVATRDVDHRSFDGPDDSHTVVHLHLKPLAQSDIAAMAQDRLRRVPGARAQRLLDATGGNPFLLVQVLDSVAGSAEADLSLASHSVAATWRAHWANLPATARQVASVVAVSSGPLTGQDLREILDNQPAADIDSAVLEVLRSSLLAIGDGDLGFPHDLVRDAVVDATAATARQALRHRVAAWHLDRRRPVQAAAQIRIETAPGDAVAAQILLQAAERLLGDLPKEAAQLALLSIQTIAVSDPDWLVTGERALHVLSRTQRPRDAVRVADTLLARIDDANRSGAVEVNVATALWWSGRLGLLVDRVDRQLNRQPGAAAAVRARLLAVRALARTRMIDGQNAAREAQVALASAQAAGDDQATALARQASGEAAKNQGRHADSLRHFRELRMYRGGAAVAEEVMALQLLDRYHDAQTLLDQAWSDPHDATAVLPSLLFAQTWQDFNLARFDDAASHATTLVELGEELGNGVHTLEALMILAAIRLNRADLAGCASLLDRASEMTDADDDIRMPGLTLMRSWHHAQSGRPEAAMEVLRPMLAAAEQSRTYWPWWPGWMHIVFAIASSVGDEQAAATAVRLAEIGAERNPGVVTFDGIAVQLRALLANDLEGVARGADILERSPRPVMRASARRILGQALLAAGDTRAAIRQLDAAWDGFNAAGSEAARLGVQQVMRGAGVRRRKWTVVATLPSLGWESLTAAELRVAQLIAAGHTNRSASSTLGLSVNTVGTHLTSVFRKVGVQSRVQLANLVHSRRLIDVV